MLRFVSLSITLGRGLSKAVSKAFPQALPVTLPEYVVPVNSEAFSMWWINGYLTLYFSIDLRIDSGYWVDVPYSKYRHIFSVSFDISRKSLAIVMADALGISYYLRSNFSRIDIIGQSTLECTGLALFFKDHPIQSYKQNQVTIWSEFVNVVYEARSVGAPQSKYVSHDMQYLSKLINKFNAAQR